MNDEYVEIEESTVRPAKQVKIREEADRTIPWSDDEKIVINGFPLIYTPPRCATEAQSRKQIRQAKLNCAVRFPGGESLKVRDLLTLGIPFEEPTYWRFFE